MENHVQSEPQPKKAAQLPTFLLYWPLAATLLLAFTPITMSAPVSPVGTYGIESAGYSMFNLLSLLPVIFLFALILGTTILITAKGKIARLTWPVFIAIGLVVIRFIFNQGFVMLSGALDYGTFSLISSVSGGAFSVLQLVCIAVAAILTALHVRREKRAAAMMEESAE